MVVCATLVALFPITSNTTLGLRSIEPNLQSYFKLNRATRLQILLWLRISSALPYFFGGLRNSSGLALIGAVVAEFVAGTGGSGAGLAYQILQVGFQLNIPRMFAALLLISLAGVALLAAMAWVSGRALGDWHASETSHDEADKQSMTTTEHTALQRPQEMPDLDWITDAACRPTVTRLFMVQPRSQTPAGRQAR